MNRSGSVHTAYFPEPSELTSSLSDEARERTRNWDRLIEVRDQVLKRMEEARNEKRIGAPLEAHLTLHPNIHLYPLLKQHEGELAGLFIVSKVDVACPDASDPTGLSNVVDLVVIVERASGQKCERCWKYTGDVGADPRFPTVCACCAGSIDETLNG
jgi:isoleucyl-tRNA synthetase